MPPVLFVRTPRGQRATSVPAIGARGFEDFGVASIGSIQQRCWLYSRWKSWNQKIGEAIVAMINRMRVGQPPQPRRQTK